MLKLIPTQHPKVGLTSPSPSRLPSLQPRTPNAAAAKDALVRRPGSAVPPEARHARDGPRPKWLLLSRE